MKGLGGHEMRYIFYMSISIVIPVAIIIAIRKYILHRVSKMVFKFFWIIMIFRLLFPIFVPLNLGESFYIVQDTSEMIFSNPMITITNNIVQSYDGEFDYQVSSAGVPANMRQQMIGRGDEYRFKYGRVIFIVWVLGCFGLAIYMGGKHFRFVKECKEAIPISADFYKFTKIAEFKKRINLKRRVRICQFDRICTPFTYGILTPVVIIPKAFIQDEKILEISMLHELVHVKQFDVLIKLLLVVSVCVHWFNPLVWVMYVYANKDIELSCDEKVVELLGEQSKKEYINSLLKVATAGKKYGCLTSLYSNFNLKERCVIVMKTRKKRYVAVILSILVASLSVQSFAEGAVHANVSLEKEDRELNRINNLEESSYKRIQVQIDEETLKEKLSLDDGESWLSDVEAEILLNQDESELEFWTSSEFEIWLENFIADCEMLYQEGEISLEEKKSNIIFYSEMLQEIKQGALYTKGDGFYQMEFNMDDYQQGRN